MALRKPVIFISSTRLDLQDYRDEAIKIIKTYSLDYYSQEVFVDDGKRNDAVVFSKERMKEKECNWYLGIIAFRRGHMVEGLDVSVTEAEYNYAMELKAQGIYDRVFIIIASSKKSFKGKGAIIDNSDDDPDPENDQEMAQYTQFHQFRKKLNINVNTQFSGREDFTAKLQDLLNKHWEDVRINMFRIMIKKYNTLYTLIREVNKVTKDVGEALQSVKTYKDLHDHVHKFRQDVIVPVEISLADTLSLNYWDNNDKNDFFRHNNQLSALTQRVTDFGALNREFAEKHNRAINILNEQNILFSAEANKADEIIGPAFNNGFAELTNAVELLFKEFNAGLMDKARALEIPVSQVLKALRAPFVDNNEENEIEVNNQEDRDAWVSELNTIAETSKSLIQAVTVHGHWQGCHETLLEVDPHLRNLEYYTDKKTSDSTLSDEVCEFLEALEVILVAPGEATNDESLFKALQRMTDPKLKTGRSPEDIQYMESMLVERQDWKHLKSLFKNLRKAFETCPYVGVNVDELDFIDLTSGTPLLATMVSYRQFRKEFDDVFYEVDLKLKARCELSHRRVENLFALLDELHAHYDTQSV